MDCYELNSHQFIHAPIEKVFSIFSKPENLENITPERLHFTIHTPSPIPMNVGQIIDYTIRIRGIPMHWRSRIASYDPPNHFIDEQIKGPYSIWHHTHTFVDKDGGTYIIDHVKYKIPFGFIGKIANSVWVSRDLNSIFSYRKKAIVKIFRSELKNRKNKI